MGLRQTAGQMLERTPVAPAIHVARRALGSAAAWVLMYHRVAPKPGAFDLALPAETFDEQIGLLRRRARVVTLRELVELIGAGLPLREPIAAITFDDGYRDNLEVAAPILRRHGVPATVFVTSGFVDGEAKPFWDRLERVLEVIADRRPVVDPESGEAELDEALRRAMASDDPLGFADAVNDPLRRLPRERRDEAIERLERQFRPDPLPCGEILDWDGVRALAASGIEIGCHTISHPMVSRLTRDEAAHEIAWSRRRIEEEIDVEVVGFAFPFGDYSLEAADTARDLGLSYACTTDSGANRAGDDPFLLRRIACASEDARRLDLKLAASAVGLG